MATAPSTTPIPVFPHPATDTYTHPATASAPPPGFFPSPPPGFLPAPPPGFFPAPIPSAPYSNPPTFPYAAPMNSNTTTPSPFPFFPNTVPSPTPTTYLPPPPPGFGASPYGVPPPGFVPTPAYALPIPSTAPTYTPTTVPPPFSFGPPPDSSYTPTIPTTHPAPTPAYPFPPCLGRGALPSGSYCARPTLPSPIPSPYNTSGFSPPPSPPATPSSTIPTTTYASTTYLVGPPASASVPAPAYDAAGFPTVTATLPASAATRAIAPGWRPDKGPEPPPQSRLQSHHPTPDLSPPSSHLSCSRPISAPEFQPQDPSVITTSASITSKVDRSVASDREASAYPIHDTTRHPDGTPVGLNDPVPQHKPRRHGGALARQALLDLNRRMDAHEAQFQLSLKSLQSELTTITAMASQLTHSLGNHLSSPDASKPEQSEHLLAGSIGKGSTSVRTSMPSVPASAPAYVAPQLFADMPTPSPAASDRGSPTSTVASVSAPSEATIACQETNDYAIQRAVPERVFSKEHVDAFAVIPKQMCSVDYDRTDEEHKETEHLHKCSKYARDQFAVARDRHVIEAYAASSPCSTAESTQHSSSATTAIKSAEASSPTSSSNSFVHAASSVSVIPQVRAEVPTLILASISATEHTSAATEVMLTEVVPHASAAIEYASSPNLRGNLSKDIKRMGGQDAYSAFTKEVAGSAYVHGPSMQVARFIKSSNQTSTQSASVDYVQEATVQCTDECVDVLTNISVQQPNEVTDSGKSVEKFVREQLHKCFSEVLETKQSSACWNDTTDVFGSTPKKHGSTDSPIQAILLQVLMTETTMQQTAYLQWDPGNLVPNRDPIRPTLESLAASVAGLQGTDTSKSTMKHLLVMQSIIKASNFQPATMVWLYKPTISVLQQQSTISRTCSIWDPGIWNQLDTMLANTSAEVHSILQWKFTVYIAVGSVLVFLILKQPTYHELHTDWFLKITEGYYIKQLLVAAGALQLQGATVHQINRFLLLPKDAMLKNANAVTVGKRSYIPQHTGQSSLHQMTKWTNTASQGTIISECAYSMNSHNSQMEIIYQQAVEHNSNAKYLQIWETDALFTTYLPP